MFGLNAAIALLVGYATLTTPDRNNPSGPVDRVGVEEHGFFSMNPLYPRLAQCEYCYEASSSPTAPEEHYFEGNECGAANLLLQVASASALRPARSLRANSSDGGGGCKDCHSFNSCHTNTQSFACRERHDPCSASTAVAISAIARHDQVHSVEAAELTKRHPGAIFIAASRGIVAVLDCRGAIVAYRPIRGERYAMRS